MLGLVDAQSPSNNFPQFGLYRMCPIFRNKSTCARALTTSTRAWLFQAAPLRIKFASKKFIFHASYKHHYRTHSVRFGWRSTTAQLFSSAWNWTLSKMIFHQKIKWISLLHTPIHLHFQTTFSKNFQVHQALVRFGWRSIAVHQISTQRPL